jgi:CRISPR/Cas system-associated exonuclease Cas4 (RecB family)
VVDVPPGAASTKAPRPRLLSRKAYSTYQTCPLSYQRHYIQKERTAPENKVNAILGNVLGKLMEDFYNEELYRRSDALEVLLSRAFPAFEAEEADARRGGIVDWRESRESRSEVMRLVLALVPEMIRTIQAHRLIGREARSEVDLRAIVGNWELMGRADLVFTQGDAVTIMDGKSSKHREKYVDEDQLLYYAYLHRLSRGIAPRRLGWMFYRYSGDMAVDWMVVNEKVVAGLEARVATAIAGIEAGKFPANPGRDACRYCIYQQSCPPRTSWAAERSAAHKKKRGVVLPALIDAGGGITEVALED